MNRVENFEAKRAIAQKLSAAEASECQILHSLFSCHMNFENIVGKGEISRLAKSFSALFNNYIFIFGEIP